MNGVFQSDPGAAPATAPSGEPPDGGDGLGSLTTVVSRALRAPAFIVSIVGGRLPTIAHAVGMPEQSPEYRSELLTALCLGAATNRETLIIDDADLQGATSGLSGLGRLGVRACICTPLRLVGWRIRGLLAVIDEQPREWSEEALALVSDVAQIAAMEMRVEAGMQTLTTDSRQLSVRRSVIEGFLSGEPNRAGVDGLLGSLGENLNWDVASIWLSEGPSTLHCIGGWTGTAIDPQILADLWTDQTPVDETDLLAKVLSHQQPVWMPELEGVADSRRAELARSAGLASALWFPVRCSGALGAVELLSFRHRRDAERMPLLENSLGRLIGSLLGLDWRVANGEGGATPAQAQVAPAPSPAPEHTITRESVPPPVAPAWQTPGE